jgi:hypothetical protein
VNRRQAHAKAHVLWGTNGIEPGDRVGFTVIRRKNIVDRFEVGYYTRGGRATTGMVLSHDWKVMGAGRTWEEAFERAARSTLVTSSKSKEAT